ncbi:DUF2520 domain-containing protein [Herbaspirillum sp. RTI4]|uniref:Rossmann-like and DUF2520 domain-containing protein n=1 Tax=Herbaspirillum sp. RTI4 TaxID=3048640 RepID=UPI002AB41F6A|nr:DUF2520 domain-containing protein [Herbaspirillum sp. RTI4]MDY7579153.1 DUF2520 domain-containing protein [Herbaspirillum sp. RTI4]MEA9981268.1 DUF2520 domain-containing protein [Herbaspirillum sp. RTI4]
MQSISFIGAGRVGATLATAFHRSGLPVSMIASRNLASAQKAATGLVGCSAVTLQQAAAADLVFITVPDDDIGAVASSLIWRKGQYVVHCSGATEIAVLETAARAGAITGGFHPLQIFSDPQNTLGLLAGSTAGIEGAPELESILRELAVRLGMIPMLLPPGSRALYHCGSVLTGTFLLSLLNEAVRAWTAFGIDEQQALRGLLPVARGTLETAAIKGPVGALSGPISRGDSKVVARHLRALEQLSAEQADLYRQLAGRQLEMARINGKLQEIQLTALKAVIEGN